MNRETLETARKHIVANFLAAYHSTADNPYHPGVPPALVAAYNDAHALICRELEHTREPHDVDECMRVIEEARGHLQDALSYHHVHHAGVQRAKDTLDEFAAKGGAS